MKRCEPPTNAPPPEPFSLLLDETLSGKSIVQALKSHGIPVVPHEEFAARGISDIALMDSMHHHPELYFLTRDRDFRYKKDIVATLQRNGVGAFVLTASGNRTGAQLIAIILQAWPAIARFVLRHSRPFVAKILGDGSVHLHNE